MSTAAPLLHHQQACCGGKPSLLRALVGAYGGPYYALGVLKVRIMQLVHKITSQAVLARWMCKQHLSMT
jgi:hypothetical protein